MPLNKNSGTLLRAFLATLILTLVFALVGCGGGGKTATSPAPTLTFTATPSSIAAGQSSTLTWTSTNATSVTSATGFTTTLTSGTLVVSPAATTTYTLTVQGAGGSVTQSATVTVGGTPAAPTVTITTPDPVGFTGDTVELTWTSTNATSVSASNLPGSPTTTSGTVNAVLQGGTNNYAITVAGPGGTATSLVSVEATTASAPAILFYTANANIAGGESTVLKWKALGTNVFVSTDPVTAQPLSGSQSVSPTITNTYRATVTSGNQRANAFVTVNVSGSPTTLATSGIFFQDANRIYNATEAGAVTSASALPSGMLSLVPSTNEILVNDPVTATESQVSLAAVSGARTSAIVSRENVVQAVASPNGQRIAVFATDTAGGLTGTINIYNRAGALQKSLSTLFVDTLIWATNDVLAFSSGSNLGSSDVKTYTVSTDTEATVRTLTAIGLSRPNVFAISPTLDRAIVLLSGGIRLVDLATGADTASSAVGRFSPDGAKLAFSSGTPSNISVQTLSNNSTANFSAGTSGATVIDWK